jgi:glyoxylase-like metal-dependent hydrolase (beta-lactamase superfamily II)
MSDAKVREILPGIFIAHLPLPMRPTIVNVTLLHSHDEWALVDTGIHTPENISTFQDVLKQIGCRPEQISKIICTHHHPDHFGTSKTFKALTGAAVYLSRAEYDASLHYLPGRRTPEVMQFFRQHGVPLPRIVTLPSPGEFWARLYDPVVPDHFIEDGDVVCVGDFEILVIGTPGHTPGHCVMYLKHQRIMIAGDHLLPKITPHVGVFPGGPTNPLADFLASQRKVQDFDVALVLPAHGGVFHDHRHRASQIIQHHDYRLREMLDIVRTRTRTAYEVAGLAFAFDIDAPFTIQIPATFETLAHLEYLRATGKVERAQAGEEIVYRATGVTR